MKYLFVTILLLSQGALAGEMPMQEKISAIVKEVQAFKKDCLENIKVSDVKEITAVNKTSESMDKKMVVDEINKYLMLKIDPASSYNLKANLSSSSVEKGKVKTSNYKFKLVLTDSTDKEVCKNTYTKEIVETR